MRERCQKEKRLGEERRRERGRKSQEEKPRSMTCSPPDLSWQAAAGLGAGVAPEAVRGQIQASWAYAGQA